MSKKFKFILSTPEAVLFDGEAEYVGLTTPQGEIGIMADHLPIVSLISAGSMKIVSNKGEQILATGGGFVKITPEKTIAFTQTAEFAESIDEKRVIEAMKDAKQKMQEQADEVSLADATALLERNIARLKTLERKKKRSHR